MIDLKDDDPTIFEYLLLYLYTLDYEDGSQLKEDEGSSLAESTRTNTPDAEDIEATPGSPVVRNEDNDIRANPSESAPQIEDHPGQGRSSLMINVQVYAMADKFDIAELKVLAKQKFSKSAQGWPLPDFPRVVHEALTSTPESDRGLRDILRRILAEHVKDICPSDCPIDDSISRHVTPTATQILRQQWYDALRDEGRFLYEVLGTFASNRAQLEAGLWMTNVDLTTDLQSSQQETLMLSINVHRLDLQKASDMAELEAVKSRGARLMQEIDTRDQCRHCKQAFQASFDDISAYGDWHVAGSLRCKLCRTKHSF